MVSRTLMTSKDETWNTPAVVIDRLKKGFAEIGLDPCDNATSITRAQISYRLDRGEDGLALSWKGRGLVFVNPPYGREISKWASKAAKEAAQDETLEIVLLVPARVDTAWFTRLTSNCGGVCFLRGRLRFGNATTGAPFPSAIVYHGPRLDLFIDTFKPAGALYIPLA